MIIYSCSKCGNTLISFSKRCSNCGYSRFDNIKYKCQKCGNKLNSPSLSCSKCGIIRAGCKNWIKYNKIYILKFKKEYVFMGYKHQVKDYLINTLKISESIAIRFLNGAEQEVNNKNKEMLKDYTLTIKD